MGAAGGRRLWTSDLHFGHANIIRYCHRPYAGVREMNQDLVTRWNDTVGLDDEVWVLGDVAMGPIEESLELVRRLNGRKILVAGNHDRCWSGYGHKADRWIETYRRVGFDEILQGWVPVTIGGVDALACHFPYEGDSQDEDRFVPSRPPDEGRLLLHGHVHDRWRVNGRQVNVGVDVWDYRPVTDDEVLAAVAG
jgi:calcineurin-like phosphoesterase family protein